MEKILNEYRYTIGKKGYLSMYAESGELVARCNAGDLFDDSIIAFGTEGHRMIEGDELAEVKDWIASSLEDEMCA